MKKELFASCFFLLVTTAGNEDGSAPVVRVLFTASV